jgi:hypothetical protein
LWRRAAFSRRRRAARRFDVCRLTAIFKLVTTNARTNKGQNLDTVASTAETGDPGSITITRETAPARATSRAPSKPEKPAALGALDGGTTRAGYRGHIRCRSGRARRGRRGSIGGFSGPTPDVIVPGVTIAGVEVGNKTRAEATQQMRLWAREALNKPSRSRLPCRAAAGTCRSRRWAAGTTSPARSTRRIRSAVTAAGWKPRWLARAPPARALQSSRRFCSAKTRCANAWPGSVKPFGSSRVTPRRAWTKRPMFWS